MIFLVDSLPSNLKERSSRASSRHHRPEFLLIIQRAIAARKPRSGVTGVANTDGSPSNTAELDAPLRSRMDAYLLRAIALQNVPATLLNNLRVQELQSHVTTAVAIGIVIGTFAPFTVLPARMSGYRVPELNVRNSVLKSLSFLFEYIGEMAKD